MSIAAASAAGCAFVGSALEVAVKPIEVAGRGYAAAARYPKAAAAGLVGAAGASVAANALYGDEFDGFDDEDDEEEIAQP